jgi:hypothetical protein
MDELITLISLFTEPSPNYHKFGSYGLKAMFEHLTGQYISEQTFVNIMLFVGIESKRVGHHYFYKLRVKPSPDVDKCFWGRGNEPKFLQT